MLCARLTFARNAVAFRKTFSITNIHLYTHHWSHEIQPCFRTWFKRVVKESFWLFFSSLCINIFFFERRQSIERSFTFSIGFRYSALQLVCKIVTFYHCYSLFRSNKETSLFIASLFFVFFFEIINLVFVYTILIKQCHTKRNKKKFHGIVTKSSESQWMKFLSRTSCVLKRSNDKFLLVVTHWTAQT